MPDAVIPTVDEHPGAGSRPAARRVGPPARRRRAIDRLRGVVPVLLVVLAAGLWFSYYARRVTSWTVMTDELLYTKLAVAVASSLSPVPRIHGEYYPAFSQLYPILTAPFYRLFDMPTAFEVVHVFNAFLMASTAIPVYLLTRQLVERRWPALLAAALSVCIPWVTMSLMVLTESAAYPAFAWALLAMHRSIARNEARADVLALLAIAVAFLARTQFILLAVLLPLAIVVHEFGYVVMAERGNRRRALREAWRRALLGHRVLLLVYGIGAAALVPMLLTGTAARLLGAYAVTAEGALLPPGIWVSAAAHIDYVIVGLGVLPFVAAMGWCLLMLVGARSRGHHAFAVLVALLVPALTLQVASFSMRFAQGLQERYLFYVAPLILVGFVVSLLDLRRLRVDLLVAGGFTVWMLGAGGYTAAPGPYFTSPSTAFHQVLDGRSEMLGSLLGISDLAPRTVILVGTACGALALFAGVRRLRAGMTLGLAGALVLLFMVLETNYVFGRMLTDNGRVVTGGTTEGRDWVDQRVGDAEVAMVPSSVNTAPDAFFAQQLWWDTEFWNESVSRSYVYEGAPAFTAFPFEPLEVDYDSGRIEAGTDADLLLLPAGNVRLRPVATEAIPSPDGHLTLLRTPRPLRAEWATRGILDDGWTVVGGGTIRVYGSGTREARRIALTIASSPDVGERRRYTLDAADRRRTGVVAGGATAEDHIDVCVPADGHVDVDVGVDGTTVLADGREVGLRVTSIQSTPSPVASC